MYMSITRFRAASAKASESSPASLPHDVFGTRRGVVKHCDIVPNLHSDGEYVGVLIGLHQIPVMLFYIDGCHHMRVPPMIFKLYIYTYVSLCNIFKEQFLRI